MPKDELDFSERQPPTQEELEKVAARVRAWAETPEAVEALRVSEERIRRMRENIRRAIFNDE